MNFMNHIYIDPETCEWKTLARHRQMIASIREFREIYGADLRTSKDVVEEYFARWNEGSLPQTSIATEIKISSPDGQFYTVTETDPGDYRLAKGASEVIGRYTLDGLLNAVFMLGVGNRF